MLEAFSLCPLHSGQMQCEVGTHLTRGYIKAQVFEILSQCEDNSKRLLRFVVLEIRESDWFSQFLFADRQ